MYTQCPECRTAYQIGPEDLRRAHGRVRCGACTTVFDALPTLSHEPPPGQPAGPEAAPPPESSDAAESPARDEPLPQEPEAGPESIDEALPEPEPEAVPEPEPEPEPEAEPQRFDDDTPLEEILATFGGDLVDEETDGPHGGAASPGEPVGGVTAEQGEDRAGGPAAPQADAPQADAPQGDDLDEEDEWRALLAELELDGTDLGVGATQETGAEARSGAGPAALEETTAGTPGEIPGETTGETTGETPGETPAKSPPEIAGESPHLSSAQRHDAPGPQAPDSTPAEEPEAAAATTLGPPAPQEREKEAGAEDRDGLAASAALFDEIVQSGEFAAILGPDADTAAAATDGGRRDRDEARSSTTFGDTVTAPKETAGEPAPAGDDEEQLVDQALMPRRRQRSRTLLWSVAAALLVAALGLQAIHVQRAQLATHPAFGPRLQQIYGVLGMEVEPRWNIGALCVESSSGDAGADTLEITSVIAHQGDRPQPYPLLQVALTDRWQSVIGSRSIEADDYLPGDGLREDRLYPGDRVRASARLADPGSEAAGYELHVCYRDPDAVLRCSGACR